MTVTYPQALPAGTQYYVYGPTADNTRPHWYSIASSITDNMARFSIADGGLGDDDLAANGSITDTGGAGVNQQISRQIPTLSEWGLILLMVSLAAGAVLLLRKRNGPIVS